MAGVPATTPSTGSRVMTSYVEWGAVAAGAVASLAVSAVLLTFGAAVGLTAVSPWTSSATITGVAIGSGFWVLLVSLWSFALGGYLAARLRHRWNDGTQDEVDFRDNAHGLLAWALAVTFAAVVAASTTPSSRPTAGSAVSSPAATQAVDRIVRSSRPDVPEASEALRSEVARVFTGNLARAALPVDDKTYLASVIARRNGIEPAAAESRVEAAFTQYKQDADRVRKAGVVMAFLTAATLLLGAATAWWAAGVGGNHRDQGTTWDAFRRSTRALVPPVSRTSE
jgi:hypothetical protein